MPLIERRYAEALVDISAQGGAIEAYQQEFQSIVGLFNTQPDFKLFLLNPKIKTDAKKDVIKSIFSSKIKVELLNFLMLLLDKGRIKFLPGILDEFIKLADKKNNILNMIIISASPIEEKQINEIKEKYIKLYKASSAKVTVEVDPNQIGGLKVRIGDRVLDGTVKGRMEGLRELLLK